MSRFHFILLVPMIRFLNKQHQPALHIQASKPLPVAVAAGFTNYHPIPAIQFSFKKYLPPPVKYAKNPYFGTASKYGM